ncbi:MAG: hypothetical protein Q8R25_03470 [bacterium]|nr:hypothetical protein [bacterium]
MATKKQADAVAKKIYDRWLIVGEFKLNGYVVGRDPDDLTLWVVIVFVSDNAEGAKIPSEIDGVKIIVQIGTIKLQTA